MKISLMYKTFKCDEKQKRNQTTSSQLHDLFCLRLADDARWSGIRPRNQEAVP